MKKLLAWCTAGIAAVLLAACGGGNSPPAPTAVSVVPHDSSAIVTWNAVSGVEYWVWTGQGNSTYQSCVSLLNCIINRNVKPPFLVTGLTNGTSYATFVNGTSDGSPVGDSSTPVNFVPKAAGLQWNVGKSLGAATLRGVGYTPLTSAGGTTFVTVGTGGVIFSSGDSINWAPDTSPVTSNLNAVLFGQATFTAVGDSGVIITSTDGVTWTSRTSGTGNALYGLTTNASSLIVAVGAGGTILVSSDGATWTTQTSGSTSDLFAATFGTNLFVAVGRQGTLLTSIGGANWTTIAPQTTSDLRGVAFGNGIYVAVGDSGALVTSADGVTWTARAPIAQVNFAAVIFGSQFVAVGNGGNIYVSADGINWQPAVSGTSNDLYGVTFAGSIAANTLAVGYTAVGAAGTNLTSY